MHCSVIPYAAEHLAPLRQLFLETRRTSFTWQQPTEFKLLDFDRTIEGEELLVAVQQEVPIGFIAWWPPDNFVHSLFVAPAWQGWGVGQALLHAALPHLGRPATLKCLQTNLPALGFYAAQGWKIVGTGEGADGPYYLLAFHEKSPTGSQH